jgi:heme/copper-type cytochrome/quinol oxidase subunit 3
MKKWFTFGLRLWTVSATILFWIFTAAVFIARHYGLEPSCQKYCAAATVGIVVLIGGFHFWRIAITTPQDREVRLKMNWMVITLGLAAQIFFVGGAVWLTFPLTMSDIVPQLVTLVLAYLFAVWAALALETRSKVVLLKP